jgi:hypothetical protein
MEDFEDFRASFPTFQLEDELAFEAGRDVMYGQTYTRRRRARDVQRAAERAAARSELDQARQAAGQSAGQPLMESG